MKKNGQLILATKKGLFYLEIDRDQNKLKSTSTTQIFTYLKESPCGYFFVGQDLNNKLYMLESASLQILMTLDCTVNMMAFSSEYIFVHDLNK